MSPTTFIPALVFLTVATLLQSKMGSSSLTISNLECYLREGQSYRGYNNVTGNGVKCQKWNSQKPHSHKYRPEDYLNSGLQDNYCRNPNGSSKNKPWCFTMSDRLWDYCTVPKCDQDCFIGDGANYRGNTTTTVTDKQCQIWQADQLGSYEPGSPLHNHCRNPGGSKRKPYCYVSQSDQHWEYCNIEECKLVKNGELPNSRDNYFTTPASYPTTTNCILGPGTSYRGKRNMTKRGHVCQNWSSMYPHSHSLPISSDNGLGDHNYCRNPDNSHDGPWCFTMLIEIRSESCGIETCTAPKINRQLTKSKYHISSNTTRPWKVCCVADGLPRPNVTWWKVHGDGSKLLLQTERGCFTIDDRFSGRQVLLECKAENMLGTDFFKSSLVVSIIIRSTTNPTEITTINSNSLGGQTIGEDDILIKIILPLGISLIAVLLIIALSCVWLANRVITRKKQQLQNKRINPEDMMSRAITDSTELDRSSELSIYRRSDKASICSGSEATIPYPKHVHVSRSRIAIGERVFETYMHGNIHRGSVYKILPNEWKSTVIIKQLSEGYSNREYKLLYRELDMLLKIGTHKNLLCLLGASYEAKPDKESLLLILEYASYGDLESFLRYKRDDFVPKYIINEVGFNLATLIEFTCQLAKGMLYLSSKQYAHGNFRAATVLVCSNSVLKIADYGLQTNIDEMDLRSDALNYDKVPLPIRWMSPETLSDGVFTIANDVWSYGVVVWEIYTLGELPYHNITDNIEVLIHYMSRGHRLEKPMQCPASIYDMMCSCWEWTAGDRITFATILPRLREIKITELYDMDLTLSKTVRRCSSTRL